VDGCVFCEIVAGRAPASAVHEDDRALAFVDIRPAIPGHLLVIPKRQATHLADLDEETGGHLVGSAFVVGMRLAAALRRSGLRCEGITVFLADGEAAGQEVSHVHLHVIPRFANDGFRIDADWSAQPDRAELDAIAARLRAAEPPDCSPPPLPEST